MNHLPSVSVYNHIQSPRRKTSKSLLAVASSGFTTNTDNSLGTQNAFAALPFTLIEVDSIATNFEGESKTVLKNDAVTEASIKNISLDQYKYIHFATHGDINEVTPSQSGLILSKKQETEILFGEDGLLNAKEIASLNLNADLVVLSACNTGMGRVITGEGLLGLQRSFLAAGASSVVSSLWSIYDRSTPLFMQTFYSKLSDYEENDSGFINRFLRWSNLSNPKLVNNNALALRDAKLEMIEHPYYSHPVHWASFVITGK
ncbi:MAG: CHAT domain-containing protein [Balneolaceae bacterium]